MKSPDEFRIGTVLAFSFQRQAGALPHSEIAAYENLDENPWAKLVLSLTSQKCLHPRPPIEHPLKNDGGLYVFYPHL
jgi:hypothetical protein